MDGSFKYKTKFKQGDILYRENRYGQKRLHIITIISYKPNDQLYLVKIETSDISRKAGKKDKLHRLTVEDYYKKLPKIMSLVLIGR